MASIIINPTPIQESVTITGGEKIVRTTSKEFNNLSDKSQYKDSIVLIEDTKHIWSNNVYYNTHSFNGFNKDFSNDF